eukprot:GHVL01021418.1.p1 GENE.GHVL01021418.1~~GHVL01021418.1.p1  ORF type:complete len:359 (-),score=75.11 GHVL01021418.1:124-1200(-)
MMGYLISDFFGTCYLSPKSRDLRIIDEAINDIRNRQDDIRNRQDDIRNQQNGEYNEDNKRRYNETEVLKKKIVNNKPLRRHSFCVSNEKLIIDPAQNVLSDPAQNVLSDPAQDVLSEMISHDSRLNYHLPLTSVRNDEYRRPCKIISPSPNAKKTDKSPKSNPSREKISSKFNENTSDEVYLKKDSFFLPLKNKSEKVSKNNERNLSITPKHPKILSVGSKDFDKFLSVTQKDSDKYVKNNGTTLKREKPQKRREEITSATTDPKIDNKLSAAVSAIALKVNTERYPPSTTTAERTAALLLKHKILTLEKESAKPPEASNNYLKRPLRRCASSMNCENSERKTKIKRMSSSRVDSFSN